MRCTEALTPQLMAVKRHRPVHALSREDKEKCELEEMKKSQFKAHGLDARVFKPPVLPAKKEGKPTKIEPFHLTESHKKEVLKYFGSLCKMLMIFVFLIEYPTDQFGRS